MFPIVLLIVGSVFALIASIIVGRAKPGRYESPLLRLTGECQVKHGEYWEDSFEYCNTTGNDRAGTLGSETQ